MIKKSICRCLIICFVFLAGCRPAQNSGSNTSVAGGDLIPANARSMTISYKDYVESTPEPELKTYQAGEQQFRQFCDLIKAAKILPLTDNDALSFSNIAYMNAADISVRFDTGEPLYIYTEGGIGRFADRKFPGLPMPECYFITRDVIHRLQKILIPDFEKDYKALTMDLNFVKADDINAKDVNEIPLFIPQERKIFPFDDGFIAFHSVWGGSSSDTLLRAVKYDRDGNFIWMQNYTDIKFERMWYSLSDCIETKEGGFAFSVSGNVLFNGTESWNPGDNEKEEAVITSGWLVKCDKRGNIIWKEPLEFRGGNEAEYIRETENGDILTAATCQEDDGEHYKSGDSSYGYTDLLFMKYDKNGKRTGFKKYGGSDFDSLRGAYYSPDIEWVVWGSTQSCNGDITQRKERGVMLQSREFLTVFDDNLNEKWQYIFEGQEEIFTSYVTIVNKDIYLTGPLFKDTGKHNQTAVFKFNSEGTLIKSKIINALSVAGICTADVTVLVSVNPSEYNEAPAIPQVYRLDANLEVKKTINDTISNGFGYKVIPTDDNGFYTVQTQSVKYLPQPLWMNRSITDYATVLSRYSAAGDLLYRKTYDKNHEVEDYDIVLPLPDGRVIIDR